MKARKKRAPANPWPAQAKRRSRDFDVKKVAILDAAARLFRDRGYKGTSLNDLAKALNVTKPTIYYYFSSKDEILRSIKDHTHDEIIRMLLDVRASDRRGIDKIAEAMRRYVHILASDYGRVVVLVHDRVLKKKSRAAMQDRTEEIDSHLFAIYDQAAAEGDIRTVERHVMHYTLFGALNWSPNWYNPEGKISPEKLADLQVTLLVDGLRKRS
jgi:AcrR family transcriptional regulator